MPLPDSPQKLEGTPINDVPRDTLLRLLKPLLVDEEVVGKKGEYLLVPSPNHVQHQIRILFEALKEKDPGAAYVTLMIRNLIAILYITPSLHDGAGEAFTRGATHVTQGSKRNIAPRPITAEVVTPTISKASELPKNRLFVLAASYQHIFDGDTTHLSRTDEEDVPTFSGSLAGGLLTEGMFLRKGMPFTLVEQDGKLLLRKWDNENESFAIDPNCELEVCIATKFGELTYDVPQNLAPTMMQ